LSGLRSWQAVSKPVLAAVLGFDTLQKPQLLNQRTAQAADCPVTGLIKGKA
jgi:hypothetical protein